MNNELNTPDADGELEGSLPRIDALHDRLIADGAMWRTQWPPADHVTEATVLLTLKTADGSSVSTPDVPRQQRQPDVSGIHTSRLGEATQASNSTRSEAASDADASRTPASIVTIGRRSARPPRHHFYSLFAAALVVIIGFAAVVGQIYEAHQSEYRTAPAPPLYQWSPQRTLNSASPEDAFDKGMVLTPCGGKPTHATSVTWFAQSPNYGIALIRADCRMLGSQQFIWLFTLGKTKDNRWIPQAGYTAPLGAAVAAQGSTASVPVWLSLPYDQYVKVTLPPGGLNPEATVVTWYSNTRAFAAGHFADQAIRPAQAVTLALGQKSAWMTQTGGLVSIVVPLADGTTFFFAGTASTSETENYARHALAHLNELLPPLPR